MSNIVLAAGSDEGYQISRSVRLRSSASAYFNRTPASAGNRKTWTWSGWVKRGKLAANSPFINAGLISGTYYYTQVYFDTSDCLVFANYSDSNTGWLTTAQVFRDPSAWYHIVVVYDSTNATSTDRMRVHVNGTRVTNFIAGSFPVTYPSQNVDSMLNTTSYANNIGKDTNGGGGAFFDGYLTEINFIDGQALTPSSFGETDSITGVWKPKKYAGTYGTNGFYLNFSDNSSNTATTIGKDNSGNGNNWTPNNISVTAGVTYDSMLDVPTLYADGGNGRGNYCTLNPLDSTGNAYHTVYAGNLNWQTNTGVGGSAYNVTGITFDTLPLSGLYYYEFVVNSISAANTGYLYHDLAGAYIWWVYGGTYQIVGSNGTTGIGALSNGDIIQVAVNMNTGKLWFGRNGTWYTTSGTPDPAAGTGASHFFTPATQAVFPTIQGRTGNSVQDVSFNFGQRPFAYTPPTGFKALNTQNLPEPTIKKGNQYFDATTYTGTGVNGRSVANTGAMQPDLVWIKARNAAYYHVLFDSVRGTNKQLSSNATDAETTSSVYGYVSSFNADGFSVWGGSTDDVNVNDPANTYVAWQWKESPSAGFDIVTYTGTGSATTVAHSLGVAPKLMFIKARSLAGSGWTTYSSVLGAGQFLSLNATAAATSSIYPFNNTAPTSSVFSVGPTGNGTNNSGVTYVAYLFADVAGFSRFGSYTGNGSADGPFVFTGFRPRYVMIKRTDSTGDWFVFDTARNTFNTMSSFLRPNWSDAEATNTNHSIDLLSNGFKSRAIDAAVNASGGTFIYAAFSEHPFKNSLAR